MKLDKLRITIDRNTGNEIGREVIDEVEMDDEVFLRGFTKLITGRTPYELIEDMRIELAESRI